MKLRILSFFKGVIICSLILTVFIFAGVFYYEKNGDSAKAQNNAESEPYYTYFPKNAGLMFERGGSKTYVFLNFEEQNTVLIFDAEEKEQNNEIYGYSVDYNISLDNELFGWIIDTIGGLEIGELRYTGTQVIELLSKGEDYEQTKRDIIVKIIEKVSRVGLSRGDLLYIIEESETNLTVPDCYYWYSYLKDVCSFKRIID